MYASAYDTIASPRFSSRHRSSYPDDMLYEEPLPSYGFSREGPRRVIRRDDYGYAPASPPARLRTRSASRHAYDTDARAMHYDEPAQYTNRSGSVSRLTRIPTVPDHDPGATRLLYPSESFDVPRSPRQPTYAREPSRTQLYASRQPTYAREAPRQATYASEGPRQATYASDFGRQTTYVSKVRRQSNSAREDAPRSMYTEGPRLATYASDTPRHPMYASRLPTYSSELPRQTTYTNEAVQRRPPTYVNETPRETMYTNNISRQPNYEVSRESAYASEQPRSTTYASEARQTQQAYAAQPAPTAPPSPQQGTEYVEELGRAAWKVLHGMAQQYPDHPSAYEQSQMLQFMEAFSHVYPCKKCSVHLHDLLQRYPPDVRSGDAFYQWMIFLHNQVNADLGKPIRHFP